MLLLAGSGASASMHVGMHLGQRRFERTFLQAMAELVRFSPLVFVFFKHSAASGLHARMQWIGSAAACMGPPVPSHFFS